MLLADCVGQLLLRLHPVLHVPAFLPPPLFIQLVGPPGNALVVPSGLRYLKRRTGLFLLLTAFWMCRPIQPALLDSKPFP